MPAYPEGQVAEIADMADHVSLNSVSQLLQHGAAFRRHRPDIHLGLRINPGYSPVSTDLYNPCSAGSRLGTRLLDLERGFGALEQAGLEPDFLHCHNLCESGADALAQTLAILARDFGPWLHRVRSMNLGGGHLMSREDYDLEAAAGAIAAFKAQFPHLQLIMEPGSALVWETGYFRSKVLDIMETEALPVAIMDSSLTAHLPDVLEMPYQPRILGAQMQATATHIHLYRLGGQSCLAGDQVGNYAFKSPLKPGDDLVFLDMMHYTMVKTHTFNGMELPSIGVWRSNGRYELIRRFGYSDFESRLS
jgi:carboxynorspermidine decarboxylase